MNKDEIEKRLTASCDILTFLDHQIAQQVQHQVEQRLTQEREHLRCVIIDERKLVAKLITELVQTAFTELVQASHVKMIERVEQILGQVEAKLDPLRRSNDDQPPSKH